MSWSRSGADTRGGAGARPGRIGAAWTARRTDSSAHQRFAAALNHAQMYFSWTRIAYCCWLVWYLLARIASHTSTLSPCAAPARRRWHPLNTPVRRAFSTAWLLGRRAGRDARWAGHIPRGHVPPQAGPARRAATGRRPDRLGRSPGRPVHTYVRVRAREKKKEEGRTASETGGAR